MDTLVTDDIASSIDAQRYRAQVRLWQLLHGTIIACFRVKETTYYDNGFNSIIFSLKRSIQFTRCFDVLVRALTIFKSNTNLNVHSNCYGHLLASFLRKCIIITKESLKLVNMVFTDAIEIYNRVIFETSKVIENIESNLTEVELGKSYFLCECKAVAPVCNIVDFSTNFYCIECDRLLRFCRLSHEFIDDDDARYLNALACPICECEIFASFSLYPMAFKTSSTTSNYSQETEEHKNELNGQRFADLCIQLVYGQRRGSSYFHSCPFCNVRML